MNILKLDIKYGILFILFMLQFQEIPAEFWFMIGIAYGVDFLIADWLTVLLLWKLKSWREVVRKRGFYYD